VLNKNPPCVRAGRIKRSKSSLFRGRELFVFGVAEGKNHLENRLEKDDADSKASAFAERLSKLDAHDDAKHEVGARKKGEETKHGLHVQDLEHGVSVVDWDERLPAFFAGFGEDFPFGDNDQNDTSDDAEDEEKAEETGEDSCANRGARRVCSRIS